MTKQESIFEVAKTLYLVDKVSCFNQLSKINFNELSILFGKNSDIEINVRGLMLFLAITEDISNNINLPDEIMRIFGSSNTSMFNDMKSFATYLFNISVSKGFISRSSLNLSKDYKEFTPNIDARLSFSISTSSSVLDGDIKDDIINLLNLFDKNLLTQDRLDSFIPDNNSDDILYNLKIKFATKRNLFDYGIKNIKLLIDRNINDIQPTMMFLQNFIPFRGLSDVSIIEIIELLRSKIHNTKNEMTLDRVLFLLEYQSLNVEALKKSNILERLQSSINRYTALGFNTQSFKELLKLKGL